MWPVGKSEVKKVLENKPNLDKKDSQKKLLTGKPLRGKNGETKKEQRGENRGQT